MPCYHPLQAYQCQQTKLVSFGKPPSDSRPITLPCGQCIGCRERRARDWALRCMHEASLYKNNCFITLTYDDQHLPPDRSLHYIEFQKFMKRLRFSHRGISPVCGDEDTSKRDHYPIRFYMCGEYGTNFGRPHFHAILFNFDFEDKVFFKKAPSGEMLYRSKSLESLWHGGFSSIGSVTFQSAAYVARYINAKITGKLADDHYSWVDRETGEVHFRTPEFNKMSLKPGIGAGWLEKFQSDVFPHDYIVNSQGAKLPVPKYYNKRFQCSNPYEYDEIQHERFLNSRKFIDDNTPERLQIKKQVHLAKLKRLKRTIT